MTASPIDVAIFIAAFGFNVWALKRRPDWVAGILLATLLVSVVIGQKVKAPDVVGALALLDAVISISMLLIWTHWRSRRAQLVGILSFLKCFGAVIMSAGYSKLAWDAFAISQNAIAFLQIMVAGGFMDGIVSFFDRINPSPVSKRRVRSCATREG